MSSPDRAMMSRALLLAARGRGLVEPNPLVGAVVAQGERVAGAGWHERFGGPHAEVNALAAAGEQARDATLYVTLEPCCHTGKTPPCTDTILKAGIRRVVAAMMDPFPLVGGMGLEQLRRAGVAVEVGIGQEEARELNAPYLKLVQTSMPYVIAKWAMSFDGKIATHTGESKWISGPEARARVHELRGRVDAVLVGIGTVLADDPLLTARPPGPRRAARIVLDSRLRLPRTSQLVRTAQSVPVIVFHADAAPAAARAALEEAGCTCVAVPSGGGRLSLTAILGDLGRRRFTNLLVEGGSAIHGGFRDADAIDEAWVFIAPKLVGGADAPGPVGGQGIGGLTAAAGWEIRSVEQLGGDCLLRLTRVGNGPQREPSG